jgi:hypothetical protein
VATFLASPCETTLGFTHIYTDIRWCHKLPSFFSELEKCNKNVTALFLVSFPASYGQSEPPLWPRIQRPGFDSWRYQIFWEIMGLERGPLSLVNTNEELLERKNCGSGLGSREYGRRNVPLTNADWRRSRTHATEFPFTVNLRTPKYITKFSPCSCQCVRQPQSRLSRQCGILNISQTYRPQWTHRDSNQRPSGL